MYRGQAGLIAFMLCCNVSSVATAQDQSNKLDAAKQTFRDGESGQATKILAALRGLMERSQKSGDLDAVLRLNEELETFESHRKYPSSVSMRTYDLQVKQLARRLNLAFETELRDLTKAGKIDQATELQKELGIHQASNFRTFIETKWIPIFAEGRVW
jgi:hypothetical protein